MPGGTPASPKIAAALAVAPADAAAEDARPLSGARRRSSRRWSRARWSTTTRPLASRARKLAKVMVGQTAKNMIQAFFFDLNAIKSGQVAAEGLRALAADEGRHPRRRHDGRRHRLRASRRAASPAC